MKITILCPNVSSNALGRAHLLYLMLREEYEVEIVGPAADGEIWEPLRNDESINIRIVRSRRILKNISGDIIYASKPLLGSFGIGLLGKFKYKKKLILDIDDWQLGFVLDEYRKLTLFPKIARILKDIFRFYWINSIVNNYICEKLVSFADKITVSNKFLLEKFGGELVRHTRDPEIIDPEKFDRNFLRNKFGIGKSDKVIIFPGTRRSHKGLENLIGAVSSINDKNLKLHIMGSSGDNYSDKIDKLGRSILGERFRGIGIVPFHQISEYLSVSDLVVIPQKRGFSSIGQFPVKLFDAMSMGKPILATNLSDMGEIIGDTGWVINSGDISELEKTIRYIINNPEEAAQKGKSARERFRKYYSMDIERAKLIDHVNQIQGK